MDGWWRMHTDNGADRAVTVHLFGGPYLTVASRRVAVPEGSKRLLAFVALRGGRVERRYVAGALWPDVDDLRAAGNLRSALWRLNRSCGPIVDAGQTSLALRADAVVDVHVVSRWARRLISRSPTPTDLRVRPDGLEDLELLPGWYDDWVLMEQERLRLRLLHALEALGEALTQCRRYAEAVEAAMLAATSDPLRESARRVLIEAHVAEGNVVEARRQFEAYRSLLLRELAAEPTPSLSQLVRRDVAVTDV